MQATSSTFNAEKINLRKEKVINLQKSVGLYGQEAQVVLVLDYSISMERLYEKGEVQEFVERFLPLGLVFDDNGEVDTYLFQNNCSRLKETVTLQNVNCFVKDKIMGKYSMGGTSYAPVINTIVKDFAKKTISSGGGFFGLGKKTETTFEPLENPVYVIFITDGENDDKANTEEALRLASKTGIFFQFIGIGNQAFNFLRKLDDLSGRFIDNANFFQVSDLASKTDDELYKLLLTEFPSFIKEAKKKNLLK